MPTGKIHRGFSLIELMIVVSIVGIMAAVAMPSFQTWVQNAKIRTVAEALQNGIRVAQIESLRRGSAVTFFLTNDPPVDISATPSATGLNWVVCTISSANASLQTFIQGGSLAGTATGTSITNTSGTALSFNSITFNSIGRLVNYNGGVVSTAAGATFQIQAATGTRKLNVIVSPSGSVRMCDPAKTRSSTSPDGC